MRFTIDRFEGEFALVELSDGSIVQIPKSILPIQVKEGDIVSLKIEVEETTNRKDSIEKKMAKLFKD